MPGSVTIKKTDLVDFPGNLFSNMEPDQTILPEYTWQNFVGLCQRVNPWAMAITWHWATHVKLQVTGLPFKITKLSGGSGCDAANINIKLTEGIL